MKTFAIAAVLLAGSAIAAAPAAASVVVTLPGGTALPIPATNQLGFAGPATLAPGVTYASTEPSAYGYTGGYGFSSNGFWSGTPMIGLDRGTGIFELAFANPIRGFLGELNWTVGAGGNATISIYDSANVLLESLLLENGANVVAPGNWGFLRASNDIAYVRFSEEYIGVRNISTLAVDSAVPEPATWALLMIGFGFMGWSLRRRRHAVTVSYA